MSGKVHNKVMFGMNLNSHSSGKIEVEQKIEAL